MARIWDGDGVADDQVYFTKDNGDIVTRTYVRDRVARYFARFARSFPLSIRKAALVMTVGDDAWMAFRNRRTVGSLCRDAFDVLIDLSMVADRERDETDSACSADSCS